jgi:hypothetical protein
MVVERLLLVLDLLLKHPNLSFQVLDFILVFLVVLAQLFVLLFEAGQE